jgi:hypothetical protein
MLSPSTDLLPKLRADVNMISHLRKWEICLKAIV